MRKTYNVLYFFEVSHPSNLYAPPELTVVHVVYVHQHFWDIALEIIIMTPIVIKLMQS